MSNRWLARYRYTPSGVTLDDDPGGKHPTGSKAGVRMVAAPKPVPAAHETESRVRAFFNAINPYAAVVASILTIGAAAQIVRSHHDYYPVPPSPSEREPLGAIEIERASNIQVAQRLLESRAPSAQRLAQRWNRAMSGSGSSFRIHGPHAPTTASEPIYLPVPRAKWETQFDDLQDRGFVRLQLNLVHVPSEWSSNNLENHKYRWATLCHVDKEWIDMWSSFRSKKAAPLRNECVTGGLCLILSDGDCDARAFNDLQNEE